MSIHQDDFNKLKEKAKLKKDGVFSYQGLWEYGVKNNRLRFLGHKFSGEVYEVSHGWLVSIGKVESYKLTEELKKLIKIYQE